MPRESKDKFLGDPIVIDPPGFDAAAAWKACSDYVDRMYAADRPEAAAAGADPGICSCPKCRAMHWAFGRHQRCKACGFEYPTDAWAMYSWGVQEAKAKAKGLPSMYGPVTRERYEAHPYYRYGLEHPVDDPMTEYDRIDWQGVMVSNRDRSDD